MCLHDGALCSIHFHLICNMTTFRKKWFDHLTPSGGRGYVLRQNMCLNGALCSIPFNLINNTTTFSKKYVFTFEFHPRDQRCV